MKAFITICSLFTALYLAWQHHDLEAKAEETKVALDSANARIAELTAMIARPPAKINWVEERNRNWSSPLSKGSYDNRQAVTPPVIYSPQGQTTYYSDLNGRYWIDSSGVKHYGQ